MGDKYLEEFDKISGRGKWRKGMGEYRRAREQYAKEGFGKKADYASAAEIKGYADEIMKNPSSVKEVVAAMQLYDVVNKEDSPAVKRKLIEVARRWVNSPNYNEGDMSIIGDFLREKLNGSEGLEKKTLAVIGGFGIIASLFFLSPVVTGNAIGSIGEMTSGILGGALFVLGVGGIFISCRRK